MASSPWGKIDHVEKLIRGVSSVSTPGHGGFRVAPTVAKHLTKAALDRAIVYGGNYFFEEDCNISIVLFEMQEVRAAFFAPSRRRSSDRIFTEAECMDGLLENLTRWNLNYLRARGIEPKAGPALDDALTMERDAKMRAEKHPDLITGAISTDLPGVTKVWTADGKEHMVRGYKNRGGLLSTCEVVAIGV